MAGQTPRFALNFFGGDTDGAFSDDNDKYTSEDRLLLDTLLAALEKHNHRVPTELGLPSQIPDLAYVQGTGTLEGGTTYYYVISYVDADGLETISGPEASISTPDILPVPDPPQGDTSTGSGSLTPGLYYYALTGLRGDEESPLGAIATVTVLTGENTVTLTCPVLGEATAYQLWRMKDTDPQWTRVVTGSGDLVDDGSVTAAVYGDPSNTPPTSNSGVADYSISITLTGDDVSDVQSTSGWRIYRSTVSGQYSAASLVHEAIERTDETDATSPLLTTYLDDGDAALTGSPVLVSSQLQIPAFTFEEATTLPAASGYPDNYPILDGTGTLYINRSGTWTAISGSGGGGSGTARGLPFMGAYDPTYSSGAGYQGDDIVIYQDQLWEAVSPSAGNAPTAEPNYFGEVTEASPVYGVGTQYGWAFNVTTAVTLTSFDWYNVAGSTDPIAFRLCDASSKLVAGPYLYNVSTSATPTTPGWTNQVVPATPLSPGTTYYWMAYSGGGAGVSANVGLIDSSVAATGNLVPANAIYYGSGYSSYDNTHNVALRFYSSTDTAPPWTVIATLGPQRGVALFTGSGAPSPEPTGSQAGDVYIDASSGDVYTLTGA